MDRFEKFSALSLILLIISTSLVFFQASAIPSPSRPSNVEPGSMTKPCNYIVFKDGSKILANNCSTGVNDYSETDIAITLQDIFTNKCANGCTVKVQNDLYTTSSTVNILTDNVWLDFGWAQITYNGAVTTQWLSNIGHIPIRNLYLGMLITNGQDLLSYNINIQDPIDSTIENLVCNNATQDGICRVVGAFVGGNPVYDAKRNYIHNWHCNGDSGSIGDQCRIDGLSDSVVDSIFGSGPASTDGAVITNLVNCTITNIHASVPATVPGIDISGSHNSTFSGLYAYGTGNAINSAGLGLKIRTYTPVGQNQQTCKYLQISNVFIDGPFFIGISIGCFRLWLSHAIVDMHAIQGTAAGVAITQSGSQDIWITDVHVVEAYGTVAFDTNISKLANILNIFITDCSAYHYDGQGVSGIALRGTVAQIYVDHFDFQGVNNFFPITTGLVGSLKVKVTNSPGYNPFGKISLAFNDTIGSVGTFYGVSAIPTASTTYTVVGTNIMVTSAGGTGVSIAIKDAAGNTLASGLTTLSAQFIPWGYTINFGAFSVAPTTVTVFGD